MDGHQARSIIRCMRHTLGLCYCRHLLGDRTIEPCFKSRNSEKLDYGILGKYTRETQECHILGNPSFQHMGSSTEHKTDPEH